MLNIHNQALKDTDGRLFPLGLIRLLRRKTIIDQARLLLFGVLEDNRDINRPAEQAGARRYKTYRVYQKALS